MTGLPGMAVDEARKLNDRDAPLMFGPVEDVFAVENRAIPGPGGDIGIRIYRPDAEAGRPMLVYFHGGGWVVGSLESHDGVARFLCKFGRCLVASVDYRLGPEHRFPAAVEDAWAATTWAAEHAGEIGGDSGRLAVGGDSAGGNLAAVVARWARERGRRIGLELLVYRCSTARSRAMPRTRTDTGSAAIFVRRATPPIPTRRRCTRLTCAVWRRR